jgi:hypothetical protein
MVSLIWKHFKLPPLDYESLPEAPLARWRDLADRYDQLRDKVSRSPIGEEDDGFSELTRCIAFPPAPD